MRKTFKNNLDVLALAVVIGAFVAVAAQRLGTVPVPETDESYTLQVAYEMLNRGQLSLPMYRYLGGNIENVWHSYTPVYYVILSGFLKVTGWGVLQGRVFNLITSVLLLVTVHAIGRRLFDWRVGLIAVLALVSDPTFFERSRLLRNDYAAAAFAMLAYYLYEIARVRRTAGWYVACGLAAGAGVMCHTNVLYIFGGIGLLILLENGWRALKEKNLYFFGLAALAVMAYEIVYDIIDYKNFVLQNRDDRLHFGVLDRMGWWRNIVEEGERYARWHTGGRIVVDGPRVTLHIFEVIAALSIVYLVVVFVRQVGRGFLQRPECRLLVMTLVVAGFHAVVTSHKNVYYMAHLSPWFALCAGTGFAALLNWLFLVRANPRLRHASLAGMTVVALIIALFCVELVRQNRRVLGAVANPDLPSFDHFRSALRSAVPEGICPVAMKAPALWLAFPEFDRCFASIESRMRNIDLKGQEYALILPAANHNKRQRRMVELDATYPLIGELKNTPYGRVRVYYTGTRPELVSRPTARYYFLHGHQGFITGDQVASSPAVWSRDLLTTGPGGQSKIRKRFIARLEPETVYALKVELGSVDVPAGKRPEVIVKDRVTKAELGRIVLSKEDPAVSVFKTSLHGTIKVRVKRANELQESGGTSALRRIVIIKIR